MELRNFDKLIPFIESYNNGEIIYKDGALYRTIKRLNQNKTISLEEPELMRFDSTRGYWRVSLFGVTCYEHIVIYAIHNGIDSLKEFECIDHKDTNKKNNHIENLEGITIDENNLRAKNNGLMNPQKGSKNVMAKLTIDDVEKIKRTYATGEYSQKKVAEMFNISQTYVYRIVNNKRWRE